eukprot:jgi/Botrbrau1/2021/Bobra.0047s0005.1
MQQELHVNTFSKKRESLVRCWNLELVDRYGRLSQEVRGGRGALRETRRVQGEALSKETGNTQRQGQGSGVHQGLFEYTGGKKAVRRRGGGRRPKGMYGSRRG